VTTDPSSHANVTIERAEQSDFVEIRHLQKTVPGSTLDDRTLADAAESGDCLVARVDGAIVGFALVVTWFYGRRLLSLIAVSAERRRSGIAEQLVRRVVALSPNGLFTSTNRSNLAGRKLFEKLGFERSGIVENLDEGDPELVYFKKPDVRRGRIDL
jgi:ribosomal protein S18 acetylase RimI-like enzyme